METRTYNVYKFAELTEEQQQKAIDNYRYINVDYEWWGFIYEDAERIGLKITSFDLDRHRHAKGRLTVNMLEVIQAIQENHGKECDTYKMATSYFGRYQKESARWYKIARKEDTEYFNEQICFQETDEYNDIESEFLYALLEEYSIILQQEAEFLMSDESVRETLIANEYVFTESCKID